MRNDTVVKIETAIIEYLKANGGIATLSQTDIAKIANVNKSTITRNMDKLDFQDKVKAKPDGNKFYFELVSKDSNKGRSAVSSRFADESIFWQGINLVDTEPIPTGCIKYLDINGVVQGDFAPRRSNKKDIEHYRNKMCPEHFQKYFM